MLLQEKPFRLILGSQSPRRRQLLEQSGLPFESAKPFDCEEVWPAGLRPERVARYLSQLKSHAYPYDLREGDILLTADTTVLSGDEILGKPRDRGEAIAMLERLSGRRHAVVSGVTLRSTDRCRTFSVRTDVWFRPLSREEIEYYVDTFHPMDKAGAYGIQEWIGCIGVQRIAGSFFNVMGLPIQRVYNELNNFI